MSTQNRTASRGGKKQDAVLNAKAHKTDQKSDPPKDNPKAQPTAEQMRIAQIIETGTNDDSHIRDKVRQVSDSFLSSFCFDLCDNLLSVTPTDYLCILNNSRHV